MYIIVLPHCSGPSPLSLTKILSPILLACSSGNRALSLKSASLWTVLLSPSAPTFSSKKSLPFRIAAATVAYCAKLMKSK